MEKDIYKDIFVKSIRQSFIILGKDISHLSDEEIEKRSKTMFEKEKELNLDVNEREEYLKVVYEIFEC